jgi:hypothetical protein
MLGKRAHSIQIRRLRIEQDDWVGSMSKRLAASQTDSFVANGIIFPIPVLSGSAIHEARQHLDAVL